MNTGILFPQWHDIGGASESCLQLVSTWCLANLSVPATSISKLGRSKTKKEGKSTERNTRLERGAVLGGSRLRAPAGTFDITPEVIAEWRSESEFVMEGCS